jgi:hypothetical protein
MARSTRFQTFLQPLTEIPRRVIQFVSAGVTRIFTPNKDDYPATGVQPYEGDPDDAKHH